MFEWDSRMQNNHSVKILKAAIPFLDVEQGEQIDMVGLLNAVRPFLGAKELPIVDMILQLLQMKDMMQMFQMMQQMSDFEMGEGNDESVNF
ncbi:MAG: hypothetical protein J5972_07465 [Eubacterium sp.]|nr:hypothetical protein [Eubacterium sp.]